MRSFFYHLFAVIVAVFGIVGMLSIIVAMWAPIPFDTEFKVFESCMIAALIAGVGMMASG